MDTLFLWYLGQPSNPALQEVRQIVHVINGWKGHFKRMGVLPRDIEFLAEQIDRPFLLEQRFDY